MLKKIMLFSTISLTCLASSGEWSKNNFKYNEFNLPYQLFKPNNIEKEIPLVIYLHGSGEAGIDNEKQMYDGTNIGPQYFASEEIQNIQNAYVLAPQTTPEIRWASVSIDEYDFKTTPITPFMNSLLHLIDNLEKELKIDPKRIYIAGLSRGGQGVWNAAMNRPSKFAAIVPVAGSGSPKDIDLIKHIPTWVFHGNADDITPIEVSQNMVDALKKKMGMLSLQLLKMGIMIRLG